MKGNKGLKPSRRKQIQDVAITSNQWQTSPKQQLFLSKYFDPASNTYGNVYQSAMTAGYSESYARNLTRKEHKNMWIMEYLDKQDFKPEHITAGITNIATSPLSRQSDKLKAYELLAKLNGMLVDRTLVGHVNIEQAIANLK